MGHLDVARRDQLVGWAWDPAAPDQPVALQVLVDGAVVAEMLANFARPELKQAGIGTGRNGFDLRPAGGLSATQRHVVRVVRASDGAEIGNSPQVIEPLSAFDADLQGVIARAVAALDAPGAQAAAALFLAGQVERLLQQRADAAGQRSLRAGYAAFRRRWGPGADAADGPPAPARQALVIDDDMPDEQANAGSVAVMSHMRALQAMGYQVRFLAAKALCPPQAARDVLAAAGIEGSYGPFVASVEEELRRLAGCLEVIYLHRVGNAAKYLELARFYCPQARLIYSVADLHHVRLSRQAAVEGRPELALLSERVRMQEFMAALLADAVITHSPVEAELLQHAVPGARVHVVGWAQGGAKVQAAWGARQGVAFIGNYAHGPNVDAAFFLVREVMPLVWAQNPAIGCLLVGSAMPPQVAALALEGPVQAGGVQAVGPVADLGALLGQVRLTVAPLRYGAGIKGKVLASLAAGVPCVMSPIAAEGLALPAALQGWVAEGPQGLADAIVRLHAGVGAAALADCATFIARAWSEDAVQRALRGVLAGG